LCGFLKVIKIQRLIILPETVKLEGLFLPYDLIFGIINTTDKKFNRGVLSMAEFITRSKEAIHNEASLSQFMNKVYGWMSIGLLFSALSSYYVASQPALVNFIFGHQLVFFLLVGAQLGLVIGLSAAINRLSATAAHGLFIVYTLLTGVTLSAIFLSYTTSSIVTTFAITALSFAGLSFFGYVTKKDLGPIGTFCVMGLWGIIIIALAGFFIPSLHSNVMQLTLAAGGVIVFSGLTAYDTQKIKMTYLNSEPGQNSARTGSISNFGEKYAVVGALMLYLDFINLFLSLLRLMGSNRN
jgi:FtsH-binding integral membrane protein